MAQNDEVVVISDDESLPLLRIKSEPNDATILKRFAELEKENKNLKVHCKALQSKVLKQQNEQQLDGGLDDDWQPSATSTKNETNSDKESTVE